MSAKEDLIHLTYILECIASIEELTTAGREAFEGAKHDRAARSTTCKRWPKALSDYLTG